MSILLRFCQWLESTPGSAALHRWVWTYPVVETVHVLGLCMFLGMTVLIDLRLINIGLKRMAVSEVAQRLLPWTVAGFVVMVLSGATLFYSDPVHFYGNVFFRLKAVMLILAGINVWVFHSGIWLTVKDWDLAPVTPVRARAAAYASLILWVGIVFSGRMIAFLN